jgi:transcriptional regulator with XRE-family HTH domain
MTLEINDINGRFKELRKSLGLKQGQLASAIDIKQGTVSDIERGRIGVSQKVIKKLSENLSVSEIWLYTGTGEMIIGNNDILKGSNEGMMKGFYNTRPLNSPELAGRENDTEWLSLLAECNDLQKEIRFFYDRIVDVQILITNELSVKIKGGFAAKYGDIMNEVLLDDNGMFRVHTSTKEELMMLKVDLQTLIKMFRDRFFYFFKILYTGLRKDLKHSKIPDEIE